MSDYVLLADSAMDDVRLVCRAAVSGVMDGDALAALHRTEAMLSRLDGQTGPDQAPPLYNMAGDLVAGSEPEERVCDTCDGSGDVPCRCDACVEDGTQHLPRIGCPDCNGTGVDYA